MGSFSDDWETKAMKHIVGETAITVPQKWVSLSTADILDDESGNAEPSGNNYGRVQVLDANWDVAATRLTANTNAITFPQASGAWGLCAYWGIWDAVTNGNLIAHGEIGTDKDVVAGNTPSFATGEIEISVAAGDWFDYLVHKMLDLIFKATAFTAPAIYVGLSTSTPADDGTSVTEPAVGAYVRKLHAAWDAVVSGASENTGAITFITPTASWGLCTHMVAYDAETVGNELFWGDVTDQTPTTDDTVSFPDGDLDLSIT